MIRLISVIVALLAVSRVVDAVPSPLEFTTRDSTPSTSKIQAGLGPKLCKGGSLYFPSSPEFKDLTTRWSTEAEGDILVVVVPACEKDVTATVKFANLVNLPFLAINRGHGAVGALGNIKNGVLIRLENLNTIDIAADGNSATLGGGVYADQVLAKLAESNKVCTTGSCGCVGVVGPALGGGLGKYMGYAGLITDSLIEMDVVTADASEIKVSQSSNSDLYWGMRGAGHNFGIVTKFKFKIFDYPKGQDTYYVNYSFTEDKLEAIFEQLNKVLNNGNLPKDANIYANYVLNPKLNPKPIILFQLAYFGTAAEALPLIQPFLSLNPFANSNGTTLYKDFAHEGNLSGVGDPICAFGPSKRQWPVGLKEFNIRTSREIYTLYSSLVANPLFVKSVVQFEGYAVQGMKAVDPASTAYAHRGDNLLVSLTAEFVEEEGVYEKARVYGERARELWLQGKGKGEGEGKLTAYSNYANGDESTQAIYGYEPWRLERLRGLKKKWDPKGRFNFYNPIV